MPRSDHYHQQRSAHASRWRAMGPTSRHHQSDTEKRSGQFWSSKGANPHQYVSYPSYFWSFITNETKQAYMLKRTCDSGGAVSSEMSEILDWAMTEGIISLPQKKRWVDIIICLSAESSQSVSQSVILLIFSCILTPTPVYTWLVFWTSFLGESSPKGKSLSKKCIVMKGVCWEQRPLNHLQDFVWHPIRIQQIAAYSDPSQFYWENKKDV